MQSLCTLRNPCCQWPRNTRYQAGATPYLGRTSTGWIAPACGWRTYSITSSARARSAGGLRDHLRRKPWPRRSTSWTSITSVAGAILVNAPTLGGWNLLQGQAVAISRTTGIYALLFGGPSRRKDERAEIGVTRIECSRT